MNEQIEKLEEEILSKKKELAELRRSTIEAEVPDFELTGPNGQTVRLSELFGEGRDLLIIHNMGRSCPYCTLWADGLNGVIEHLEDRTALVLVSPDTPEVQAEFAQSRGWKFRMLSGRDSDFTSEMGFSMEKDGETYYMPGASGFRLGDDGGIRRVSSSFFGPGDDFCAVWHLYDLLEEGHAEWHPKFSY